MNNEILETVKINRDGPKGYRLINKCDFDPKKHTLYGVKPVKKPGRPKKVAADGDNS